MSYTNTATILAAAGGAVEVGRSTLETDSRAVARITIDAGEIAAPYARRSAFLAREQAEALAAAILRAADLDPDHPQPPPRLAGDYGDDTYRSRDRSLRVLERAVAEAVAHGIPTQEVLGRVANGLTGSTNGPRERLLAADMAAVAAPLLTLTQAQAANLERDTQ